MASVTKVKIADGVDQVRVIKGIEILESRGHQPSDCLDYGPFKRRRIKAFQGLGNS